MYLTDAALRALERYDWPGNVRELVNLIERLAVTNPNGVVDVTGLPASIAGKAAEKEVTVVSADLEMHPGPIAAHLPADGMDLKAYLADIEKQLIDKALEETNGVVQHAAKRLGIGRTTLVEKIRRFEKRD